MTGAGPPSIFLRLVHPFTSYCLGSGPRWAYRPSATSRTWCCLPSEQARTTGTAEREKVMGPAIAKRPCMGSTVVSVSVVSLALMVSVLWFLGDPGQVNACKCAEPGSPSEELEKFAAVFAGRVVSIEHSFDPEAASYSPEDRTTVGFEVSAVWKGAVHEIMYITTPPTGGSCGFTFIDGEEYIVYAYDSAYPNGGYTVGICSRTALLVLQRRVILQGNSWADFEAGNERVRVSHDERSVAEEEDLSVFSHNASL